MSIKDRLKKLDGHSTVSKEFRVYTGEGAILSVVTVAIIFYLLISEIYFNFNITLSEIVHVNATNDRGLEIEFDITFYQVPCSRLNIDASDPQGQPQSLHLDKKHHVWKHRVKMSNNGRTKTLIGKKEKLELGSTLQNERDLLTIAAEVAASGDSSDEKQLDDDEMSSSSDCGSCYGAGEEDECCNTCEDVRRAYKRRGWVLREDLGNIKQCKSELSGKPINDDGEGCNVHGKVALSTGGGNLHLAPGRDMASSSSSQSQQQGVTILDMLLQSFQEWNVSHEIHKIRFGPEYPAATYQLDGERRNIQDTYGMYQYYFQIVPTIYKFMNGTTIQTNQYSVTEHLRHVHPGSNRGLPGCFFFYEVSPLHVEIRETYRKGWIAFFTSVCAIIGGVVTVMGVFDHFLFAAKHKGPGELMR